MSFPLQEPVQKTLDQLVASGAERGLQVAAYHRGHLVVDAWAGLASGGAGDKVTAETLFPVFSTSKGIAATAAHLLVERREISCDATIAKVWPEFAANGKGAITLRHALSHTAGIPLMPAGLGFEELCDWEKMCAAIAGLAPVSPAGARTDYHAMTFGWIVGEIVRRIDGRAFGRFVQDEICRPLKLKSLFVGLPDAEIGRVATVEETRKNSPAADDSGSQPVPAWIGRLDEMMNRPDVRRACLPSSNGIMNARAIAAHYAALLPGGCEGVRLLREETVAAAAEIHSPSAPAWGLGYQLGGTAAFYPASPAAFGHGGYGGSTGVADRERDLAIGITRNRFDENESVSRIVREIRAGLK
ncbi:MAG: class beta-lactamase-related serine hydrolase [Verrucomicrobia bacterium]|nr:class beta-lactamase-related serine hydrolase [Verrucomicrobiota bacterium]